MLQVQVSDFKFTIQGCLSRDTSAETVLLCVGGGACTHGGHTFTCTHTHTRTGHITQAHTQLHVVTHGCMPTWVHTHMRVLHTHAHTQAHAHTCTYTRTADASGAFPVGGRGGAAIQVVFLYFSRKSLKASRITPPGPQWMDRIAWEPQETISTLQGSAILENHDPQALLATDLQSGFIAVSGHNLLGPRFVALSVQEDVIYLTGGTTFTPKKMFSSPDSPLDVRNHSER